MPSLFWPDPGPCPVCGAPHTTCTSPDYTGTIVVAQLPARDALAVSTTTPVAPVEPPPPVEFTTKTYRRALHGRGRRS